MRKLYLLIVVCVVMLVSCAPQASPTYEPEAIYTATELTKLANEDMDNLIGKVIQVAGRVKTNSTGKIWLYGDGDNIILCEMSKRSNDHSEIKEWTDFVIIMGTVKDYYMYISLKDCYFIGLTESNETYEPAVVEEFEEGPSKEQLIKDAQAEFEEATGISNTSFNYDQVYWEIEKTLLRYVLTGYISYEDESHEVIIKMEYNDIYSECRVFQIKIDGVNVDL